MRCFKGFPTDMTTSRSPVVTRRNFRACCRRWMRESSAYQICRSLARAAMQWWRMRVKAQGAHG